MFSVIYNSDKMQPVPMKSLRMLVSLIKGPDNRGDMNYEKEGDAYRELVTLLKDKSAHFTEMIDKQVTCWGFLIRNYLFSNSLDTIVVLTLHHIHKGEIKH